MSACFKLAAIPTALVLWWATRGLGFLAHDWKLIWPYAALIVGGTWLCFLAILYVFFPNLKFNRKNRIIARMSEDLRDTD